MGCSGCGMKYRPSPVNRPVVQQNVPQKVETKVIPPSEPPTPQVNQTTPVGYFITTPKK